MNELAAVWNALEGDPALLDAIELTAIDDDGAVLPSSFPVATAAHVTVGASLLGALAVWRARGGAHQQAFVTRPDAVNAFRSIELVRVDGASPGQIWSPISGFYETADGRFVQLHTNFPHHLTRTLAVLGVDDDRAAVASAIQARDAAALEDAIVEAGGCAAMARTRDEWLAHPQAQPVCALPLLESERRGEGVPLAPDPARPLSGVRVLDLTRVLAGPIATRTLAAHGADVLRVSAKHLPEVEAALPDTSLGKRSTFLDLRDPRDAATFRSLVREADVLMQSYRPGALEHLGFGAEEAAKLNPQLVYVSLSAYSHVGPWNTRRGYDTIVQTATGVALAEGDAFGRPQPRHVPSSPLDNATGYLAATAAMLALATRADRGGAHVRCSLVQTREWFGTLPRVDGTHNDKPDDDALVATLPTIAGAPGRVTYVPPAGDLSLTPPHFAHGPVAPGADAPRFNARTSPTPRA
jgi:crotonobetainyl-CoA:carnitine CoA-transferase CaiB-like acyl-CoA transferase